MKLRKPPKGKRCDASAGTSIDSLGHPIVTMCQNDATETLLVIGIEHWLCKNCFEKLSKKYKNET